MSWQKIFDNIRQALTENLLISILDIILVAALFYVLFMFLKKHNALRLIKYIAAAVLVSAVLSSGMLGFAMLGNIFSYSIILVTVLSVIIFPQELRRSVYKISSPPETHSSFNADYGCSDEELRKAIAEIARAATNMAKKNTGALMVVSPQQMPEHILESGTELEAKLSSPLLESIFFKGAPLHDGAVFIMGDRIVAAGCFLPLTQSQSVDKELGTRHRAAIGITEAYNMYSIIVSEETGVISTARGGNLNRYYDMAMLISDLEEIYGLKASAGGKPIKKRRMAFNGKFEKRKRK